MIIYFCFGFALHLYGSLKRKDSNGDPNPAAPSEPKKSKIEEFGSSE